MRAGNGLEDAKKGSTKEPFYIKVGSESFQRVGKYTTKSRRGKPERRPFFEKGIVVAPLDLHLDTKHVDPPGSTKRV